MCLSRLGLYGPRASLSLLGALITFPVGSARRKYRTVGAAGVVAGGGAVGIAERPGSEIGGRGRELSPTNRRMSLARAARRSANVAAGLMQRNHSAADAMYIDISGPPDVRRRRSRFPEFSPPRPCAGVFLWCGASLIRRAAAVKRGGGGRVIHKLCHSGSRRCCIVLWSPWSATIQKF
jgi:hypothetical protein